MNKNDQNIGSIKCNLHQFERNRYFYGKLMTVRDFDTEQRYARETRYLHNHTSHGWGVICGLAVESPNGTPEDQTKVIIRQGMALDCCGREIMLDKDYELDLKIFQDEIGTFGDEGKTIYLCVKFDDCELEPVPALANISTCDEVCEFNRMLEKVAVKILTELPTTVSNPICEDWMNLTRVETVIKEGEDEIAKFERVTPKWVRQGDVFEVRRSIKISAKGVNKAFEIEDLISIVSSPPLPDAFEMIDGSLVMKNDDAIEGKIIQSSYSLKAKDTIAEGSYQVSGIINSPQSAQFANAVLSSIEVVSKEKNLDEVLQYQWFQTQFEQCSDCSNSLNDCGVIIAKIELQTHNSTFKVNRIDNIIFDSEKKIYRQLVYPAATLIKILECLKNDPRLTDARQPLPHAITHQDGGTDEIDVTNLSGELKDLQKISVLDEGNPVIDATHLNFIGYGVNANSDVKPKQARIEIPGLEVKDKGDLVLKGVRILNFIAGIEAKLYFQSELGQIDISAKVNNGLKIVQDQIEPDYATTAIAGKVCEANDPRLSDKRDPQSHAASHQDGGIDEINVKDLSGVLADAQKLSVLNEGIPVAARTQLNFIGPNVDVVDDAANERINVTIKGGNGTSAAVTGQLVIKTDPNGIGIARVDTGFGHNLFCVCVGIDFGEFVEYGPFVQYGGSDLKIMTRVHNLPQDRVGKFDIHIARQMADERDIPIRWFAVPGTAISQVVPPTRDRVIDFLRANPGLTITKLSNELGIDRITLEPELKNLVEEDVIRRDSRGKFTIIG